MSWDIFPKSKIQYFLEKLKTKLDLKVDKETGKGLSTNDFDNTYKGKVDKIDTSTSSASGNPISISGLKSDQLAVNPIITFEPIQAGSGTPSPENVRAISGYDKVEVSSCGSDIFGGETFADSIVKAVNNTSGATKGSDSDGKYVSITSGSIVDNKIFTNDVKFKENTQYSLILKAKKSNTDRRLNLVVNYTDGTSQELTKPTASTALEYFVITTTANKTIKNICTGWQAGTAYLYYEYCGIFEGIKTTSDYQNPVIATSISEALGQTVYGGWLDLRSGKFTVLDKIIDIGDVSWTYDAQYQRFSVNLSDMKLVTNPRKERAWFSCYECITDERPISEVTSGQAYIAGSRYLYIHDSGYSDASLFKTAMTGQKIVYPLATPTEIQLTPRELILLKTYAYISTNGSNIQLSYHNGEMASLSDVTQVAESMENGFAFFDTKIAKKRTLGISGNVPTAEELSAIDYESGSQIIDFYNAGYSATEIHASLIFTRSAVGYGVGILLSYYSNGVISFVRQSNGAVVIYPITHS